MGLGGLGLHDFRLLLVVDLWLLQVGDNGLGGSLLAARTLFGWRSLGGRSSGRGPGRPLGILLLLRLGLLERLLLLRLPLGQLLAAEIRPLRRALAVHGLGGELLLV